jgi:hypothetical integral membrane protein (TIGR02206 family)
VIAPPFRLFGPDHWAALVAVGCVGALLCAVARRGVSAARAVRFGLAAWMPVLVALTLAAAARDRPLTLWDFLPLNLCDAAILLAVYALVTLRPAACELLWFWAGGGTTLAMITPDLARGAPDWGFFSFFALHGSVVIAAAIPPLALGVRLRPGSIRRALLATNVYAAAVAAVDFAFGQNFLYLRAKPVVPTLLDWMGPWPVYILVCELLAAGLFTVLYLPLRER